MHEHCGEYEYTLRTMEGTSGELYNISTKISAQISVHQALECHKHLKSILNQLILATRVGGIWSPSTQTSA